jgi:L-fuculose-phosphate aldolase
MSSQKNIFTDQLVSASRQLVELGLNRGTSGNCSVRCPENADSFYITPSAIPVNELSSSSMVAMSLDGGLLNGGKPSSEWRFHRDIYAVRNDVQAVVHAHSPFATSLACLRKDLPAFHYMVAVAGGDSIRCAPYRIFGSQALSDVVIDALKGRKACLIANHGMISVGSSLADALSLAVEVEALCEQYLRALSVGEPVILSAREMIDVCESFANYKNLRVN